MHRHNKILIYVAVAFFCGLLAYLLFNEYKTKRIKEISQSDWDIVYGSDSASLTIFMYSSYNCAFCRKFYTETLPQLKTYIHSGRVKLVVKLLEFSSDEQVLNSLKTAICINKFGSFDKLHQLLVFEPNIVYTNDFDTVINEFIDEDANIAECMLNGKADAYLDQNRIEFFYQGFTGTPTFIINNKIYKGFMDFNGFKKIIDKE